MLDVRGVKELHEDNKTLAENILLTAGGVGDVPAPSTLLIDKLI